MGGKLLRIASGELMSIGRNDECGSGEGGGSRDFRRGYGRYVVILYLFK